MPLWRFFLAAAVGIFAGAEVHPNLALAFAVGITLVYAIKESRNV